MANPFTCGSAPGRRRDADERPGSFKPGHEKKGGRKRGTKNLVSPDYRKVVVEAASRIGNDGTGKGGVGGYLLWVAKRHKSFFYAKIFTRLLVLDHDDDDGSDQTAQAIRNRLDMLLGSKNGNDRLEEKRSIFGPFAGVAKAPKRDRRADWVGNAATGDVADLMRFAVAQPKIFCNLLLIAL